VIFLTGGTGFLGRHLVAALCRDQQQVRVLTRNPQAYEWLRHYPGVQALQGDICDPQVVRRGMEGCRYVIHAGGKFRFWGDSDSFAKSNHQGTQVILEAALHHGIEKLIHISTIAVIGQPDPAQIIDENYPPNPVDPYQQSKWQGEQLVRSYCRDKGLHAVILRPGAYYGPMGEYGFNRLFFRDPMRGIIMQVDAGQHIIFPVYIADVVQGIVKALDRGETGEVYNICGQWISHQEAFDIVCDIARISWPRLPIPAWMGIWTARVLEALAVVTRKEPFWPLNLRSYVYNNWRVSNEKAQRELGFVPTDFREGARRTIAWYKAGRSESIPELEC
jgi:nucleoside-diphosphate-sugar epimerase